MQRRSLIAGNWKMHTTIDEAESLAKSIMESGVPDDRDVMLAPPFTAMKTVSQAVAGSGILIGAQNVCWEEKGAFTGADRDKKGLFVAADKGTLFLDEISTLPMELQPQFSSYAILLFSSLWEGQNQNPH